MCLERSLLISLLTCLGWHPLIDGLVLASPIFNVINLAAFAVRFVPSVAANVTSMAVTVACKVATEMQTRHKSVCLSKL